jgi:hypothetical protein
MAFKQVNKEGQECPRANSKRRSSPDRKTSSAGQECPRAGRVVGYSVRSAHRARDPVEKKRLYNIVLCSSSVPSISEKCQKSVPVEFMICAKPPFLFPQKQVWATATKIQRQYSSHNSQPAPYSAPSNNEQPATATDN